MKKVISLLLVFVMLLGFSTIADASVIQTGMTQFIPATLTKERGNTTYVYIARILACHTEGNVYIIDGYADTQDYDTITIPAEYEGFRVTLNEGALAGIGVKKINFKEGIYELPKDVCRGSSVETVNIPKSVRQIGDYAFRDCTNLKYGGTIYAETIGREAFAGCPELNMSVENVRIIEEDAFEESANVTGIEGFINTAIKFVNDEVTVGGITYKRKNGELSIVKCNKNLRGDIIIPETIDGYRVVKIEYPGFYDCGEITRIVLPAGMRSIGEQTFWNCDSLREIVLNNGLNEIGERAFEYCRELKSITIPSTVKKINDMTFKNSGLEKIDMGLGVTTIGDGAFWDCDKLENITIGDNVKAIGTNESLYPSGYFGGIRTDKKLSPFYGCDNLQTVTIGQSVGKIYPETFFDCNGLKNIYVSENNRFYKSVDGVLYTKDSKELVCYPKGRSAGTLVIAENTSKIGEKALYSHSLKELYMPEALVNMHEDNIMPEKIVVYKSINEIPLEAWISKPVNGVYNGINWTMENNTLTLIGTGSLKTTVEGRYVNIPWNKSDVKEVVIGEGIDNIYGVFKDHKNLEKITLPQSLQAIHDLSFYNCKMLESIIIPSNVNLIGAMAFGECYNLKNVNVLSDCEVEIARGAFDIADGAVVYLPNNVKRIDRLAFNHVYNTGGDHFGAKSKPQDVTIVSNAGDYVEKWAKENGLKFRTPLSVKIKDSYLVGGNVHEEKDVVYVSGKTAFEALGAKVDCDDSAKVAVCSLENKWMIFNNEKNVVATNNGNLELNAPVKWVSGVFMVPTDVFKALGFEDVTITEIGKITVPEGEKLEEANGGELAIALNDIRVSQVPEYENGAFNMIDGIITTRWSAEVTDKSDPCWAVFDLGEVYKLDKIGLSFYRDLIRTSEFAVEVSKDGVEYTTAIERRNSMGRSEAVEYYSLNSVEARYVKLLGYGNSSPYSNIKNWFSPTEVEIYKVCDGPVLVPLKEVKKVKVDQNGKVDLSQVQVTASIIPEVQNGPRNLYDGSFSTYCVVVVQNENEPPFMQIDLGEVCDVSRLGLAFRFNKQRTTFFDIRVSQDGENYDTVVPKTGSDSTVNGFETFSINKSARYIRIYGYSNTYNKYWISITEAEVYLNK